jgi:heterodisulfide reductase subunit A
MNDEVRVGVYICHCGSNIAGMVDTADVAQWASALPAVVSARDYKFMCSSLGQELIEKDIKEKGVNRWSLPPAPHTCTSLHSVMPAPGLG